MIEKLELRGISLPIPIRFGEILKHRLGELYQAFQNSFAEHGYKGNYICVYPIKVNQQRQVVEEVFEYGRKYKFGLEAGSKPELLAVLAIADNVLLIPGTSTRGHLAENLAVGSLSLHDDEVTHLTAAFSGP